MCPTEHGRVKCKENKNLRDPVGKKSETLFFHGIEK